AQLGIRAAEYSAGEHLLRGVRVLPGVEPDQLPVADTRREWAEGHPQQPDVSDDRWHDRGRTGPADEHPGPGGDLQGGAAGPGGLGSDYCRHIERADLRRGRATDTAQVGSRTGSR